VQLFGEINWGYWSRKCKEWTTLNLWQISYWRRAAGLEGWSLSANSDLSFPHRIASSQTCRISSQYQKSTKGLYHQTRRVGISQSISHLATDWASDESWSDSRKGQRRVGGPCHATQLAIVKGGHLFGSRAVETWSWPTRQQVPKVRLTCNVPPLSHTPLSRTLTNSRQFQSHIFLLFSRRKPLLPSWKFHPLSI
jgi:hypothetical protein